MRVSLNFGKYTISVVQDSCSYGLEAAILRDGQLVSPAHIPTLACLAELFEPADDINSPVVAGYLEIESLLRIIASVAVASGALCAFTSLTDHDRFIEEYVDRLARIDQPK
jgi:hypothetical protein